YLQPDIFCQEYFWFFLACACHATPFLRLAFACPLVQLLPSLPFPPPSVVRKGCRPRSGRTASTFLFGYCAKIFSPIPANAARSSSLISLISTRSLYPLRLPRSFPE